MGQGGGGLRSGRGQGWGEMAAARSSALELLSRSRRGTSVDVLGGREGAAGGVYEEEGKRGGEGAGSGIVGRRGIWGSFQRGTRRRAAGARGGGNEQGEGEGGGGVEVCSLLVATRAAPGGALPSPIPGG